MSLVLNNIINAAMVRRQLLGLSGLLADFPAADLAAATNDAMLAAAADFEEQLQIRYFPTRFVCNPRPGQVQGTDYDEAEAQYDYHQLGYRQAGHFRLRWHPVIEVARVAVEYGKSPDTTIITYPPEWVRTDFQMGTLSIIPVTGFATLHLTGSMPFGFLPMLSGSAIGDVLPQVVSIDYTAGLTDADCNPRLAHLRLALAKMAAVHLRRAVADRIVGSVSRDGVSASFVNAQQVGEQLQNDVDTFIARWKRFHNPPSLGFL